MSGKIERDQLLEMCLLFGSSKEADLFAEVVTRELEIRIGRTVTERVSRESSPNSNSEASEAQIQDWISLNPDACCEIVAACERALRAEIRKYRAEIPGLVKELPPEIRAVNLLEQDLSVRSCNLLKRAGLATAGDVFDHGDLSDIGLLCRKNIREIMGILSRLLEESESQVIKSA